MEIISFASFGLVVLDEIHIPNRKPLTNVLGGSGAYGSFCLHTISSKNNQMSNKIYFFQRLLVLGCFYPPHSAAPWLGRSMLEMTSQTLLQSTCIAGTQTWL